MLSLLNETLKKIITLKFIRDDSNRVISIATNVSMRQLQKMKYNWTHFEKMTLSVIFIEHRSRKLSQYHELKFLNYLKNRSHVYLNEMTWFLFDEFEIVVNEITINRVLKRLNWNRKKIIKQAAQRNEILRNNWMTRLKKWTVDQLIFLNKSAACEQTDDRKYEWTFLKIKSVQIQKLKRFKQWFILSVFIVNEYIVWKIHQDSIIIAIFNDFIQNQSLSQCIFYSDDELRSVLIMNNAKIHWSEKFIEMFSRDCYEWVCDLASEPVNDEEVIEKVNVFRNRTTTLRLTKQSIKHTSRKSEKERDDDFFLWRVFNQQAVDSFLYAWDVNRMTSSFLSNKLNFTSSFNQSTSIHQFKNKKRNCSINFFN